jgi:tRNA (guanine37-N1)-methyltransferase
MKINILTLFPEMFESVLSASIIGRATNRGLLEFHLINIRDYSKDKHRKADDYPFGGGAGQLMTVQPIFDALGSLDVKPKQMNSLDIEPEHKRNTNGDTIPRLLYPSPRGRLLDKEVAEGLSREPELVLLCGHYEGVDQRVLDSFGFEEISIGDYILTGGELASMVLIDAVCRFVPGVLGSDESHAEESIYSGLLEYPQYTRPALYEGTEVPDILISGDHAKIALWNFEQSLRVTSERRPDLLRAWLAEHYDSLDKKRKALTTIYLSD